MRPDPHSVPTPLPFAPTDLALVRVTIGGVCAIALTIGIARFGYTPLLPVMRMQAGLGAATAGWLATVNYAGYLTGALIASSMTNLQRKYLLYRIGLLVSVATTLAMASTTDLWLWLVLRYLAGVGTTAGPLLGAGLALNWLLRNGFRPNLGVYYGGAGIGIVACGLLAVLIGPHFGWRGQWLAFGALSLVFLGPAWWWMPRPLPAVPVGSPAAPVLSATPPPRRWVALFHVAYFASGFVFVVTATYIVDIIRHLGSAPIPGNWVWIVMGALAIPSCMAWDQIAAAMGTMRALSLAYALQTAAPLLIATDAGLPAITLAALVYGVTFMGIASLTLSIIGRLYPADPPRAMARLTMSYGIAQICGPILGGYVAETNFGYRGSLLVTAAIGCVGTLVSLLLRPPAPTA